MDTLIADCIKSCSRSLAVRLIRNGTIQLNARSVKPGYRVKSSDQITGAIILPGPYMLEAEALDLAVLYEDEDLIVINKAPGMVVHPGAGHHKNTLVNALLYHYPDIEGVGMQHRPGIIHRLDKDTSGALVIAKNARAHHHLSVQFENRTIKKKYTALVHGNVKQEQGLITLEIGRHPVDRKRMSTRSSRGRSAETSWQVQNRWEQVTRLNVFLKTGRTHQIRVHLAAIHHPVVGDPVYGKKKDRCGSGRQMLHAESLEFLHPTQNKNIYITAPWPADLLNFVKRLDNRS